MSTLIQVKGLNKFFGEKHALNNVDFDIEKGSPVALIGPNGAGKTTLFSILCGYIQPSAGSVSVFGAAPGSNATFGRLAALPQDAQLDPRFSIAHQLSFYGQLQGFNKKKSSIEVERTLELVGLSDILNEKPEALSHGMRKRVTIAQALMGSPEIVMFDEATAGLDPLHAREIRQLVASLSNEVTFILSSHDLNELERLCQQVLYLDKGVLQHNSSISENIDFSYFTLRMEKQESALIDGLKSIEQVVDVVNSQDKEYLISVNQNQGGAPLDIQILQMCHQNKWSYRQLTNGKTLENTLFK